MKDRIRSIVAQHGRLTSELSTLDDHCDLYDAGMTSHGSVAVMLELEAEFGIEFPEQLIKRSVFQSIAQLEKAIVTLIADGSRAHPTQCARTRAQSQ